MSHSDFLTRRQVADLYPIPYSTLKKLGMREGLGGPPVIRIGGSVYYHVPTFEKWLLSFITGNGLVPGSEKPAVRRRGRRTKAEIVEQRRQAALAGSPQDAGAGR
jgi:hypothetical protein